MSSTTFREPDREPEESLGHQDQNQNPHPQTRSLPAYTQTNTHLQEKCWSREETSWNDPLIITTEEEDEEER